MQRPSQELELDELYRELILDHSRRPRHHQPIDGADVVAEGYNPVCGDEVEMQVRFEDGRIADIGVIGRGCSISQASGSMMSDLVLGKEAPEVRRLTDEFKHMLTEPDSAVPEDLGDLEALQGVAKFHARVKCATLAWHTLEDALAQHERGGGSVRRDQS